MPTVTMRKADLFSITVQRNIPWDAQLGVIIDKKLLVYKKSQKKGEYETIVRGLSGERTREALQR